MAQIQSVLSGFCCSLLLPSPAECEEQDICYSECHGGDCEFLESASYGVALSLFFIAMPFHVPLFLASSGVSDYMRLKGTLPWMFYLLGTTPEATSRMTAV